EGATVFVRWRHCCSVAADRCSKQRRPTRAPLAGVKRWASSKAVSRGPSNGRFPRTQGEDCAIRREMQREVGEGQLSGESVVGRLETQLLRSTASLGMI